MQSAVDNCPERMQAAVDICPERMVGFWSGMGVETAVAVTMLFLETEVDTCAAVLRRFFWRSKKKNQKQEAADEC